MSARCNEIAFLLSCLLLVADLSSTQSCGKRKVVNQLIVNGTAAKDGHWPWHAAIFHNQGLSNSYACGGTILDQNAVLTAAHCVKTAHGMIARTRLTVQVGRHQIGAASQRVQELQAFELIVHPEYSVSSIQHDIALIMLATDITYTDYIQPVCLWNRGEDIYPIVGTKGTVVGFGIDENDDVSDTLREATIPVVSHITCIESNRGLFGSQLTSNMFCAGNRDGISPCNGDSGGGLFFNYSDTWFIRGIVSFTKPLQYSNDCDTNEYTVFTDVAKYLKWIEQHMIRTDYQSGVTTTVKNLQHHMLGTSDKPIVRGINNGHKIGLLPMSTCGPNPYASYDELSKPVLFGYPWMGMIECGNRFVVIYHTMLISDYYLITSGEGGNFIDNCDLPTVILGAYDRNTTTDCAQVDGEMVCSPPVQRLHIESVIIHPDYNNPRFANNIALIRLRDRADTSQSNVKPICLPVTKELRSVTSSYYIHTFWTVRYDISRGMLQRSLREIFPLIECQEIYHEKLQFNVTSRYICTKMNKNEETCSSEVYSAPLQLVQQVQGESRYVLYGINSIVWSCIEHVPSVFINVSSYVDWILENIQE